MPINAQRTSSNTNKPQSARNVFLQQSHSNTEKDPLTSGPLSSAPRSIIPHAAGAPRALPLDVKTDISRDMASLPAQQAGEWPIRPTHVPVSQQGRGPLLHAGEGASLPGISANPNVSSGTNNKRPNAQANAPSQEEHVERGVRIDPDRLPGSREELQRPLGGVRQDKARLENARVSLRQPARDTHVSRAQATNNGVVRSQTVAGVNQKLVQVTFWVDPAVKEHLERRAKQEGLQLSPAGAAFLRKAVQQDIDLQYSALLRPIIEDAIAKQMRVLVTRLSWLLVRVAFDAGQTRSLVTNILGRQTGVTQPILKTILESSGRTSKANIMRRTPQIKELIEAVEQWMVEDEGQDK